MKKKALWSLVILVMSVFVPVMAFAADAPKIDTGDTTFVIFSTALVFLMTPGLALFYGGMARKKNVLNTMMNSFVIIALISVQWVIVGYTIAFGPDKGGFIGGVDFFGLANVGGAANADYSATIPHAAFSMFQLMFAIITPALITGAFAERMKFPAFLVFILLWTTLVYDPLCHWVWAVGGWIRNLGALDFAGGTVVHISSGIAGLVAALVLGKRKGHGSAAMVPHNIPFVVLGAGLLWFGWFGFNAGSALSAGTSDGLNLAMSAFVATNTAAAAAVLSWVIVEWAHRGKPTVLGAATGAVVGLVAITPAAGFVTPVSSIIIGLLVSPICYFMVSFVKGKLGYDDALDAFGCHGVGGFFGAIATGFFATKSINPLGNDGLFYGNPGLVVTQLIAAGVTVIFSAVATFIILKVISIFLPLRATSQEEEEGMDLSQHGEDAYPDFAGDSTMSL